MPNQPLLRDAINPQMFVDSMRRLIVNPDFKLLQRCWATERITILENGKNKPSLEAWSELKGFDRAIIAAEKWANRQTGQDVMSARHKELMEAINGETK